MRLHKIEYQNSILYDFKSILDDYLTVDRYTTFHEIFFSRDIYSAVTDNRNCWLFKEVKRSPELKNQARGGKCSRREEGQCKHGNFISEPSQKWNTYWIC